MRYDLDIDATGLLCPLPVLKLRKGINALTKGQIVRLRSTDPASVIDVPHFCIEQTHELISQEAQGEMHVFYIKKT